MKQARKHFKVLVTGILLLVMGGLCLQQVWAAICSDGTAVPPFLGTETVHPNLLLILDNSASMLDLAEVGDKGLCYDGTATDGTESYDPAKDYAGYFRPYLAGPPASLGDTFYEYDIDDGTFVESSYDAAKTDYDNLDNAANTKYYLGGDSATATVLVAVDASTNAITHFSARGNFLNWATASKLDIQKKVLTGGKYDNDTKEIILESRGCLNHRYLKQIAVKDSSNATKYLTLGIRRPDEWKTGTDYPAHSVVHYNGQGYYTVAGGTDNGTSPEDSSSVVTWGNRDYTDLTRIEIFGFNRFNQDACEDAIEEMASESPTLGTIKGDISTCLAQGTEETTLESDSNAIFNQTTQDCWFMTKHGEAEWLKIKDEPLDPDDPNLTTNVQSIKNGCQGIYEELQKSDLTPYDIEKTDTGYSCFGSNDPRQGFIGRCWDIGATYPKKECTDEPEATPPVYPAEEVCIAGTVYYCSGQYNAPQEKCNKDWLVRYETPTGTEETNPDWQETYSDGAYADSDVCVTRAMLDYCGYFSTPEVIDPSDQEGSVSGDFFNAPAILMEAAAGAQLKKPLLTMNGRIAQSTEPEGILHNFANDIRFGAMIFNAEGQASECHDNETFLLRDCTDKRDGGRVISYMDISAAHTTQLVKAINAVKATTWTPLAEAMYNAIGYYSQDDNATRLMRINPGDFLTQAQMDAAAAWAVNTPYAAGAAVTHSGLTYIANAAGTSCAGCGGPEEDDLPWTEVVLPSSGIADPIEEYCQENNILFITEGASTVDIAPKVKKFVVDDGNNDGGDTDSAACGKFYGSTYLDDLAWYGWYGDMWNNITDKDNYQPIRTWIVESAQRDISADIDECIPAKLLDEAAAKGAPPRDDGSAAVKFEAGGDELTFRAKLKEAFEKILDRVSSGSAASVISASRSGEGALYQAIFWPDQIASSDQKTKIKWTGEVHAFFVDKDGNLVEDTNGNRRLDVTDKPVIVYYDDVVEKKSRACYGSDDETPPSLSADGSTCIGTSGEMENIKYLWSTSDWLNSADVGDNATIVTNRKITGEKFDFDFSVNEKKRRYIFTWNDLDNNGAVGGNEIMDFTTGAGGFITPKTLTVSGGRLNVTYDFAVDNETNEVHNIINWVRGKEITGLRNRTIDGTTWRLGDVIHATPISVGKPAENYHPLYRDNSYATFVDRHEKRRHVVYFGANDGMFHAVNGGFFRPNRAGRPMFCLTADCVLGVGDNETGVGNAPALGAELWAYVPYNILPHLNCLTVPGYEHKYFVDLRPRIFDARIFSEEAACATDKLAAGCIHPNGWGTILVGGMRFGGAKFEPGTVYAAKPGAATDKRQFTSSYFILDITDPEGRPKLLGETTRTTDGNEVDLGYTTVISTLVPMKSGPNEGDPSYWYLILGSGPTEVDGTSSRHGSISFIDLATLVTGGTMRISNDPPSSGDAHGTFTLVDDPKSFISDLITVDMEVNRDYMADAVYFGTVSGDWDNGWGGKLYRLITRKETAAGVQEITTPDMWADLNESATYPKMKNANNPALLIDVGKPITASPTVGTDGQDLWVYFGTGRFFDIKDKTNASSNDLQTFYGIREPARADDCFKLSWAKINTPITDTSPIISDPAVRGNLGLLNTDNIRVFEATTGVQTNTVSCADTFGDFSCLPGWWTASEKNGTYDGLISGILGKRTDCSSGSSQKGMDGWYRNFTPAGSRERNLGQATLLGGLLTFTTYRPYDDICLPEGEGFLHGLYYQTGAAWYEDVFGLILGEDAGKPLKSRLSIGKGLSTTPNIHVGEEEGGKAFIQTSVGRIREVPQPTLPLKQVKSGRIKWRDIEMN